MRCDTPAQEGIDTCTIPRESKEDRMGYPLCAAISKGYRRGSRIGQLRRPLVPNADELSFKSSLDPGHLLASFLPSVLMSCASNRSWMVKAFHDKICSNKVRRFLRRGCFIACIEKTCWEGCPKSSGKLSSNLSSFMVWHLASVWIDGSDSVWQCPKCFKMPHSSWKYVVPPVKAL